MSYKNDNQYRIYDSQTEIVHIVRNVKINEKTTNQVDNDNDSNDDF